jgi:hypothetical protein
VADDHRASPGAGDRAGAAGGGGGPAGGLARAGAPSAVSRAQARPHGDPAPGAAHAGRAAREGVQRRRRLADCAERQRVAAAVADSLELAGKAHVSHPSGTSTTSRTPLTEIPDDPTSDRGLTGARARPSDSAPVLQAQTTGDQKGETQTGEDLRWARSGQCREVGCALVRGEYGGPTGVVRPPTIDAGASGPWTRREGAIE